MKKKITTLFLLAMGTVAMAQVDPKVGPGIGIGNSLPSPAAMLDIEAENKGVLIPRIDLGDLTKFGLAGDTKDEGMLIYNKTAVIGTETVKAIPVGFYYWTNIDTPRWELITSESVLNQKIENVTNDFNTKIDNLTKIEGANPTDLSYLMAFKPVSDGSSLGDMSYLIPEKDATTGKITYKKVEITFDDLVRQSETETFIREVKKKVKNDKDVDVEVVDYYVYFSESVVREWKKANEGKDINDATSGIENSKGTKIDVIGAVTTNFGDIFNTTENKEIIEEIVVNTPGNVIVKKDGDKWVLTYIDEKGDPQTVDINALETKTKVGKRTFDGTVLSDADYKNDATGAKKGQILYEYLGEEKGADGKTRVSYYINMTADIITSIENNQELKDEIFNTINTYLEGGSNVYYGPIKEGDTINVLYYVDDKGGKHPIDISENVLNVITNNPTVIEKIKEITEVKVVDGKEVETGDFINGDPVFRTLKAVKVANADGKSYGYNSELSEALKLENGFKRLLSVQILAKDKSVVMSTVTSVSGTGDALKFKFGVGNMFSTLPVGDYDIVLEYVGTKKPVTP